MRDNLRLPDLTFPDIVFGPRETAWNLNVLLYRGGAVARFRTAQKLIDEGKLGAPLLERLELIVAFHSEVQAAFASGGSRETSEGQVSHVRKLFAFAEQTSLPLTLEHITNTYLAWCDSLHHRTMLRRTPVVTSTKSQVPLTKVSAFTYAVTVGVLIDRFLERHSSIVELIRIKPTRHRKTPVGFQADKQNLEETFAFGHAMQDLCDGLTIAVVCDAPLPVRIHLRTGQELFRDGRRDNISLEAAPHLAGRYNLANIRIEAELFMFIGQTGINSAQAVSAEMRNFFYLSHLDGYQVKDYKSRRQGTVLFEIYKDYKPHFERYLEWRRQLFPTSTELFPFIGFKGTRAASKFKGARIRRICREVGIAFVPPRTLRNTRVNWLLRKSADPDLTAEMAQHTKQTLLSVYERPSMQRAMVETTRFWAKVDPLLVKTESVGPGNCTGTPRPKENAPQNAPKADCDKPAGCLWCDNHRDVDSQIHVWALASFKHLKVIELSKIRTPLSDNDLPPAKLVVDRINDKLGWFNESNDLRREWVSEAEARIEEGDYHPDFDAEIDEMEG